MAFCANCGTQVADNAAFCPSCGKAVGQPSGAAAVAAQPAPQPPPPQAPPAAANTTAASAPLEENIAGMLAYITIIPSIVFLVIEPYNRNKFVRFHCFQNLFFFVAVIVLEIVLGILSAILHLIPVMGWMLTAIMWPLVGLAIFAVWILMMIKAYQHQIYKLPFIGDLAEKQAGA
jgi:uncharacterized membrane protein